MHRLASALALLMALILPGCGSPTAERMLSLATPSNDGGPLCPTVRRNLFFAAPMCVAYTLSSAPGAPMISAADADKDAQTRAAFISAALIDSRAKCQAFVSIFTGEQATENTVLDAAGLLLSGAGAAITGPASTIRLLSALSTATQGIKQTINADVFQQLTIALFVKQINLNYFDKLDADFSPAKITAFTSAPAAFAEIESLHRHCSIPFAAANLSASQDNASSTAGPTVFSITGTPAVGATITLVVKSASNKISLTLSAKAVSGASSATMANQLAEVIQATPSLTQAGVLVSVTPPIAKNSAILTVHGGPADISWSASATGGLTIKPVGS